MRCGAWCVSSFDDYLSHKIDSTHRLLWAVGQPEQALRYAWSSPTCRMLRFIFNRTLTSASPPFLDPVWSGDTQYERVDDVQKRATSGEQPKGKNVDCWIRELILWRCYFFYQKHIRTHEPLLKTSLGTTTDVAASHKEFTTILTKHHTPRYHVWCKIAIFSIVMPIARLQTVHGPLGKRQQKWQQSSQRHLCSSLYVLICCNLMKVSFLRRLYSCQGRESSGWEWLARLRARYATNQVWLRTKHLNSSVLSKFQHIFGLTIGLIEA